MKISSNELLHAPIVSVKIVIQETPASIQCRLTFTAFCLHRAKQSLSKDYNVVSLFCTLAGSFKDHDAVLG